MEQQKMNEPTVPQLDSSLDELNKSIEENNHYANKARTISAILYLAILVVFLGFVWMFYETIKANFTLKKVVASLETRGQEIEPLLTKQLMSVLDKIKPVYMAELKKKAKELLPQLKGLTEQEVKEIMDNTNNELNKVLKEALTTKDTFYKTLYTGITTQDYEMVKAINEKAWDDEFKELTRTTIEPFRADWDKLRGTFDKFDNAELANDQNELLRQMAHYLLLMLDKEITEVK